MGWGGGERGHTRGQVECRQHFRGSEGPSLSSQRALVKQLRILIITRKCQMAVLKHNAKSSLREGWVAWEGNFEYRTL